MSEAQIAVLIDYENVGGLDSIQSLFDQLSDIGRVIVKRAYADWSVAGKKRDQLLELGIEAVHHFRSAGSAKNSSDICLVIDAVDLLYRSPVDTFVIVSSDSDFVPLTSKLQAAGKTVIGAGRRDVVSRTLVRSCDKYIYLAAKDEAPAKRSPDLTGEATPLNGTLGRGDR
ncbi:MAG: NYN domain-containing protein [Dehalococcoidia bacterium]